MATTTLSSMTADSTLTESPTDLYSGLVTTVGLNSTDSMSNSTDNSTAAPFRRNEDLAKIEIAVQAVVLCLAILGNGLVLLILGMRRKKLSRMNMMIVHLSIADLFVAFFNVLPQLVWDITGRFMGGEFLCRSVKYFQVVAMYASSYVLVTTAIDRYLAICHPLTAQTWSSRKTHLLVGLAWGLSLALSLPQVFIFAYREIGDSGVYDCWGEFNPEWSLQAYITFITLAIYIVPFLLLAVAYGRICVVVWRSMMAKEPSKKMVKRSHTDKAENGTLLNGSKSDTSSCKPRAHVRGMSRAKVRTVKLTLTVIICYLLCWGPFFITQMWAAWDPNAPFQGNAMVIIMLLASLNSCTNPWIYVAFSDQVLQQLGRCLRGRGFRPGAPSTGFDSESRMRSTAMSTTEFSRLEPSYYNSAQSQYRSERL